MKKLFIGLLLFACIITKSENIKKEYFPKHKLLKDVFLDPLVPKMSGGVHIFWRNGKKQDLILGTFAIGINKAIFQKQKNNNKAFEIGLEFASFTQFEFFYNSVGTHKRQHFNTDFIIGLPVIWKFDKIFLRFKIFHRSTHLGDDYIFRNNLTDHEVEPITYEQMDISLFYEKKNTVYYVGLGSILRSNVSRKVFVAYAGFFNSVNIGQSNGFRFVYGVNIKTEAETDFKPGINSGIGIEFGGKKKNYPIKLMMEYYNGFMPFSAFEQNDVQMLGLSIFMKL
jgi:hypothetical protein